ncbi:HSF5 [Branchiostoma lanceolatum]|uniref:HSF5 protein n=1 Tax=Branchiostoma lanceolatum TaxID=7740 RepID=A0A8J9ZVM3_BRALA|nr:HSF5 [Branchiostoma lanceolatum]
MDGGGDEVPVSPFRGSGPLFPVRLRELAEDPAVRSVRWAPAGTTLLVHQRLLEEELLDPQKPGAFKTRTFGSFYRQMNLYGFRRARGGREGRPEHPDGLDTAELREFYHMYFQRDQPELLPLVRRPSCSRAALTERRAERVRLLQGQGEALGDRAERVRLLQGQGEALGDRAERVRLLQGQGESPGDQAGLSESSAEIVRLQQGESPGDRAGLSESSAEIVRLQQGESPGDQAGLSESSAEIVRLQQGESPGDRAGLSESSAEIVRLQQGESPGDQAGLSESSAEIVRLQQGESPGDRAGLTERCAERVGLLQGESPGDRAGLTERFAERVGPLQGESPGDRAGLTERCAERVGLLQGESPGDRAGLTERCAERVGPLQVESPGDRAGLTERFAERVGLLRGESPGDQAGLSESSAERVRLQQEESLLEKRTMTSCGGPKTAGGGTTDTPPQADRQSMPVIPPPTASPAPAAPATVSTPAVTTIQEGILSDAFVSKGPSPGSNAIFQSLWASNLLTGDRKPSSADQVPVFGSPRGSAMVQPQEFSLRPRVPGAGPRRNLFGAVAANQQAPRTVGVAATANQPIPGPVCGTAQQQIPGPVCGTAKQQIPGPVCGTAKQRIPGPVCGTAKQQIPGPVCGTAKQQIPEPVCGTADNQQIPVIIGAGRFQSNPSRRVRAEQLQAEVEHDGKLRLEVPRLDLEEPRLKVPQSNVPCIDASIVEATRQEPTQIMATHMKVPLSEVQLTEVQVHASQANAPLVCVPRWEEQQTKRLRAKASPVEELPAGLSLVEVMWMPPPQAEVAQMKGPEIKMLSLREENSGVPGARVQRRAPPWMEVPRIEVDTPLGIDLASHKVIAIEGVSEVGVPAIEAPQMKALPIEVAQPTVPAFGVAGMPQRQRDITRLEVSDMKVPQIEVSQIKAFPVESSAPQPAAPPACPPPRSSVCPPVREEHAAEAGVCARCRRKSGPSGEQADGTDPTAGAMASSIDLTTNTVVNEANVIAYNKPSAPEVFIPPPARNELSLPQVFVPPPARNVSSPTPGEDQTFIGVLQVPILKTPEKLADSSCHVPMATGSTDPVVMVPASPNHVAMATVDDVSFLTVANFEEVVTSPNKRQKGRDERESLADKTSYKEAESEQPTSPGELGSAHLCAEEDIFFSPEDVFITSTPKRKYRRRCRRPAGGGRKAPRRKSREMTHEEEVLAAVRAIQEEGREEMAPEQEEVPAVPGLQHVMQRSSHDTPRPLHEMPRSSHDMPRPLYDIPRTPNHVLRMPHEWPGPQHDVPQTLHDMPRTVHDIPRTPHHVLRTPHEMPGPQHDMPRTFQGMPRTLHNIPRTPQHEMTRMPHHKSCSLHDIQRMPPRKTSTGLSNTPMAAASVPLVPYTGLATEDVKKLPFKKRFCTITAEEGFRRPAVRECQGQGALSSGVDDLIVLGTSITLLPPPEDSANVFTERQISGSRKQEELKAPEADATSSPSVVQGQVYVPISYKGGQKVMVAEVECGEENFKGFEIVELDCDVATGQTLPDEQCVTSHGEVQLHHQGEGQVAQPPYPDTHSAVPLIPASCDDPQNEAEIRGLKKMATISGEDGLTWRSRSCPHHEETSEDAGMNRRDACIPGGTL